MCLELLYDPWSKLGFNQDRSENKIWRFAVGVLAILHILLGSGIVDVQAVSGRVGHGRAVYLMASMATESKKKPGPEPERLKIEGDPQEALRKLVTTPPPPDDEGQEPEHGEKPRGD